MSLVPSLLQTILRLDGEALVLHVGEKPYVVTPAGQVELATKGLTLDAVSRMVSQMLPVESQRALDECGAVQYEFPLAAEFPSERFTVVAARGGDDVWVEIRRRRVPEIYQIPTGDRLPAAPVSPVEQTTAPSGTDDAEVLPSDSSPPWSDEGPDAGAPVPGRGDPGGRRIDSSHDTAASDQLPGTLLTPVRAPASAASTQADRVRLEPVAAPPPQPPADDDISRRAAPQQGGVVLPMARSPIRKETPPPLPASPALGLGRLLRIAAARGASTLYLSSEAQPSIQVDAETQLLEGEPPLSTSDVEALLLDLMPERDREALRSGVSTEWICDIAEVGRVRCMSFRDHRGAGGIFRMMTVRAISAEQLGLSREIQALAGEPEGLVLVAGPRSSGKSTLISAFVDLINRTRHDRVITIESEIKVVHEHRNALVSQREVRGGSDEMLAVARAALRENPDVLVFEELRTVDLITVALDAASSGLLVIGALDAHTAASAVDRIIDSYPPGDRRRIQLTLAEHLRGVVAQVLLHKSGGGRTAAREVLLNTPAVASVIADGKTSQLPLAIKGGRKHGMVPLNDVLVALVQNGVVDAGEAYRRTTDRPGFLVLLKRQGIDITSVGRLA